MTPPIRVALVTSLVALTLAPAIVGRAQERSVPVAEAAARRAPAGTQALGLQGTAPAVIDGGRAVPTKKVNKPVFAEDGPVDTTWDAQLESLWHALARLPTAALLSAILAFRPRRRGTPRRQAPVIQTQIVLALVGAMVMLVVGASLARAFGIVGAAG